jgi:hypothetical protein
MSQYNHFVLGMYQYNHFVLGMSHYNRYVLDMSQYNHFVLGMSQYNHFVLPQIPHGLACDRTRILAATSRPLTALATARPAVHGRSDRRITATGNAFEFYTSLLLN